MSESIWQHPWTGTNHIHDRGREVAITHVTALYATRPYTLICVAYMSENSLLAYTLHEFS